MKQKSSGNNNRKQDFSEGAFWVFFSVLLVIAPVYVPYAYDFLQGKNINMIPDALEISLLVYSVSCSLLYLCFESTHISKDLRIFGKFLSFVAAVFSIVFYISNVSDSKTPDRIELFVIIGGISIPIMYILGYIISCREDKNSSSNSSGENEDKIN